MKIESKKPHAPLSSLCGKALAAVALLVLLPSSMLATTYYVSTTGKDTNSGSSSAPLATITRALKLATASGDQILLDAGTYNIPNAVAGYEDGNAYAAVILLSSANSGITIEANPSDTSRPVLNFSAINPSGYRVAGIWIPSGVSNVTFQGFDVTGIKENITDKNNQSIGIAIWGGSGCTFNRVNVHDADCVGFYLEEVSSKNTFYQCDAYNLAGIDSYSYGNADGFGCHPAAGGTGNVYNQCRSWNNSDDGYDCINAAEPVTFEHCWSYLNGNNGGNGNGFKLGGWGSQPQDEIPNPIPAHSCTYCLAADDHGNAGFYTNHQPSGPGSPSVIEYNTAYGCATGFSLLERTEPNYSSSAGQTNSNDISGINVTLHYNLAFDNTTTVVSLNDSASMDSDNSFTESITLAASDFHSTDASQITEARQSNGSLPAITFMVPVKGSAAAGLGCFTAD